MLKYTTTTSPLLLRRVMMNIGGTTTATAKRLLVLQQQQQQQHHHPLALRTLTTVADNTTTTTASSSSSSSSSAAVAGTTTTTAAAAAAAAAVESTSAPLSSSSWNKISRHGMGDELIILNVGGKEFTTLRSTVQQCAIYKMIIQAESNDEVLIPKNTNGTKIIFIDRDPTHFPLILTYLRNKAEGIAYNNRMIQRTHQKVMDTLMEQTQMIMSRTTTMKMKMNKHPKYVRLPTDEGTLQDLYIEAVHFELNELQHQLCHTSIIVTAMSALGGGRNPFQAANEAIKVFRNAALTLIGTGSIVTATLQADMDWIEDKVFPGRRAKREREMNAKKEKKNNNNEKEPPAESSSGSSPPSPSSSSGQPALAM